MNKEIEEKKGERGQKTREIQEEEKIRKYKWETEERK